MAVLLSLVMDGKILVFDQEFEITVNIINGEGSLLTKYLHLLNKEPYIKESDCIKKSYQAK